MAGPAADSVGDVPDAAIAAGADGVTIRLRVLPRAARTVLDGRHGEALRLRVQAPPVDGAANEEVRRFVAATLGVRRIDVSILTGEHARDKVVLVRGVTLEEARAQLTIRASTRESG